MLTRPTRHRPSRFLPGLLTGLILSLPVCSIVAALADALARRDVVNAQALCRHRGAEVVLGDDGTWRCVPGVQ